MTTRKDLVAAAIMFDERTLADSEDAGARHFLGVLTFDPRHLSYDSDASNHLDNQINPKQLTNQIDTDESSLLFMVAEAIKNVMVGKNDIADSILNDLRNPRGIDRVLVLLVKAWITPSVETLATAGKYAKGLNTLSPDLVSRVYLKLMTWALDLSDAPDVASRYYDSALALASPGLQQLIYGVGASFGRETRFFISAREREPLVTYSWIADRVSTAAAEGIVREARAQLTPFSRTLLADPRTLPEPIRAAELQAGWIGAYWVLERIWRVKAAILLVDSRDREERAQGITSWILSRGSDLTSLIDENENMLNERLISKVLVDDLKSGARIAFDDWVDICLPIWDELPPEVSTKYIASTEIKPWSIKDRTPTREERSVALFTALSLVDEVSWIQRFESLKPKQRLTVCLALLPHEAESLPDSLRIEVRSRLLNYCEQHFRQWEDQHALMTLAALVSELPPDSPEISRFLTILPVEYSADVAVCFPQLASTDLVRQDLEQTVSKIREQLSNNQRGTWARFARRLAAAAAQCMVVLEALDGNALDAMIDFATSKFSSADDVIDSVTALSRLADQGLLTSFDSVTSRLVYRVDVSPVDRYWTGRDDLRAINAAIAGLYARNPKTSRDAVVRLIAATRDPDVQVRLLAVDPFKSMYLLTEGLESSVDAAILGAIYDPDSRVQVKAIQGIWIISDPLIYEIAWARLVSVWETAHRRVRMAAVDGAVRQAPYEDRAGELRREILRLASDDRSLVVRRAAAAAT